VLRGIERTRGVGTADCDRGTEGTSQPARDVLNHKFMAHHEYSSYPRLPEGKLLEGIVTTLNEDRSPHVAPMGPIVDAGFARLLLRPFRTSQTYRNLKRAKEGVLHITDDVELFAKAAVGRLDEMPRMLPASAVDGVILADTCRWYAFRVASIDDQRERTEIIADVVGSGTQRDFFGFNRAKHAVIEAAILATRVGLLDSKHIIAEFDRLGSPVEKTGGHEERRAFEFLKAYLGEQLRRGTEEKLRP
jgi:hypothetical protein